MIKLSLSFLTLMALAIGAVPATASDGAQTDVVDDTVYGVHMTDLDVGESVVWDGLELVPHPDGLGHELIVVTTAVYLVSASCLHGGQIGYPYKSSGQARGWLEAETSAGCSANDLASTESRFCEADSQTCNFGWYSWKKITAPPGGKVWAWHRKDCATSHYRDWTHLGWVPTSSYKIKRTMEIACNI